MPSLKSRWDEYERDVLQGLVVDPTFREANEIAFYAGALSALTILLNATDTSAIEALEAELDRFQAERLERDEVVS